MSSRTWHNPCGGLFEQIFLGYGSHRPFGSTAGFEFFISAGTWNFNWFKFDVASGSGCTSSNVAGASLAMVFVRVHKSVDFIVIRRW